jgi:trimeric autotransporter adhesin
MIADSQPRFTESVRIQVLLCALLFLAVAGSAAFGQTGGGAILKGRVTGPGGVAVPGARVVLINPATRQRKETWTDGAGNYEFVNVSPGSYRLFIILIGFRPSMAGPVSVKAGSASVEDAVLALSKPGESSTFAGRGRFGGARSGQQSAARSGAGANVGAQGQGANSMENLLNETGDTEASGLRFSTGGEEGASGAENGNGQTGGTSGLEASASASNSFLLTGNTVNATAPMQRGHGGFFMHRMMGGGGPAPGAPGFGGNERYQGMVMFFGARRRPTANTIHGMLIETYSNSAFDARPYPLNTPSQPRFPYFNESPGLTLGGPLKIPHVFNPNKTSFFVHYHATFASSPYSLFDSVPTAAERSGDFAGATLSSGIAPTIYEPVSGPLGPRTPFPGNQIPASMLNPAAERLFSYAPLPNLPGEVQNLRLEGSEPSRNQFIMGRIGEEFSAKDNLAVFYFYNSSNTECITGACGGGGGGGGFVAGGAAMTAGGQATAGNTGFPDITQVATTRNQNVNLMETHTFSPQTVNMLTVNFNRSRSDSVNPFAFNENIAGQLGITGVSQNPMDWGLPTIGFTNFTGLSDATPSLTRNQTWHFSDYVIINRGKHFLHVGGDLERIQLNSLTDPDGEGTFDFTGYNTSDFTAQGSPIANTGYDLADFLLGLPQTTSDRYGTSANYLRSSAYDLFANDDWRVLDHLTLDVGGRWEYDVPFLEEYGHLSDLTVGPDYSSPSVVTGQSPDGLPASLLRGHADNVAPRFGLAYRPWISHSLVVRAGYGIYYDESIYGQILNNMIDEPPFAIANTLVTSPTLPLTLQDGFPSVGSNILHNTYAVNPNFVTPYAQTWDVTLEQDLSPTYILSAAYIGTRGNFLNLLIAPTEGPSGIVLSSQVQPFEYDTYGGLSLYNGLRISLRHFSRRGFMFFANYVYSKAEDDAASVGGTGNSVVQNPKDIYAEWALSSFNPTQSVHLFTRYQLPFGNRMRFLANGGKLAHILGNWALSDMTSWSSGMPLTAMLAGNESNNVAGAAAFNNLRAEAVGQPYPSGFSSSTLKYFDTAAFAVPPAGEYGDAGRDTIPGPPSLTFSNGLDRIITLSREHNVNLNVRLAANNTFNIVNFTSLSTVVNSSTFGRVLGVGAMRSVTLTARLRF